MTWLQRFLWPFAFALLSLIYFAPALFGQATTLAANDLQKIHYPLLKFVVESLQRDSILPLWNPHQFLGYSVVGNPQYGLFYPPNWLLVLFPAKQIARGVTWLLALHTCWGAWGTMLLSQTWGAKRQYAFLAGLLFAFGAFPASKLYAGHYAVLLTLAWFPWILLAYHYAIYKKTFAAALVAAIPFALAILAGHPQFVYIMGLGIGLYWLYALYNGQRIATRQLLIMGIFGLALSAITWLPTFSYQAQTVRGTTPDDLSFANQHAIPLRQVATLLIPNLFGSPLDTPAGYWGEPFYEEMTAYVGLFPIILILLAIPLRRREYRFWAMLAIFGIILSVGKIGGLYWLFYQLLPPIRNFRAPGRHLLISSLALAISTALILTHLSQFSSAERRRILSPLLRRVALPLLIATLGGALILSRTQNIATNADQAAALRQQLAYSGLFLLILTLILLAWSSEKAFLSHYAPLAFALILFVDVARIAWPLRNLDEVEFSPAWQAAADFIPTVSQGEYGRVMQIPDPASNAATWTNYLSPQGYDPLAPQGWFRLIDAAPTTIQDPSSPVNRLFGVRYIITSQPLENYATDNAPLFNLLGTSGVYYYYENPHALNRAYLAERIEIETDTPSSLQRITNNTLEQGDLVLLAQNPDCEISGRGGTATITDYQANHVIIEVNADGAGILVLSDQYDPAWQVEIDGQRAEILQANTAFRAVCIPTGQHTVRFSYRPQSFYIGAGLSGITWAALSIFGIVSMLPNRRKNNRHTSSPQ